MSPSPSVDGSATEFLVSYSDYGGERFHLVFGNDTAATYFVYDTYVYLVNPTQVQNLELDMDQVTANGETIIFGTQCSSVSGTWEYTYVSSGHAHWKPSNIPCNPQNWKPNKWHHIQIQSHRVGDVVTYDWVKLDNDRVRSFKQATVPSGLFLGWTPPASSSSTSRSTAHIRAAARSRATSTSCKSGAGRRVSVAPLPVRRALHRRPFRVTSRPDQQSNRIPTERLRRLIHPTEKRA